jgi:iron complex outermembrane receptor protein
MKSGIIHCVLSAALSLCVAPPVLSQQPASTPADASGLSEIIVTARRVEERLQDVPISITVYNQQQLANFNVVNAQDLAEYTPSLSANSNFGPENTTYAIRGFVQDAGTPPSVGVYFADVVAPRGPTQGTQAGDGAGPGNFFDLQNVQVVKGPQGTLFGRNTTGGAVLFVPQKPTSEFGGYVEGSFGNYDLRRGLAVISLPVSDTVRFRLAVDHESRNGYENNDTSVGPRTFDDIDYTAVRASLVVDVTPELENYTILSYLNSNTNGDIQKVIACNPTLSQANFLGLLSCAQLARQKGTDFYTVQGGNFSDSGSEVRQSQVVNTTIWRATDTFTIKNIASYARYRDKQATGLFGTDWQLPTPIGPIPLPFVEISPVPGGNTANQFTATEELQFQGSAIDQRLTYQAGAYFETSQPLGPVGAQSAVFMTCSNLAALQCTPLLGPGSSVNYTVGETRFNDVGLYAQSSYSLSDQLKATLGVRNTWDTTTNTSSRITYVFPAANASVPLCTDATQTLPGCYESLRDKSSALTWLAGLDYKMPRRTTVSSSPRKSMRSKSAPRPASAVRCPAHSTLPLSTMIFATSNFRQPSMPRQVWPSPPPRVS